MVADIIQPQCFLPCIITTFADSGFSVGDIYDIKLFSLIMLHSSILYSKNSTCPSSRWYTAPITSSPFSSSDFISVLSSITLTLCFTLRHVAIYSSFSSLIASLMSSVIYLICPSGSCFIAASTAPQWLCQVQPPAYSQDGLFAYSILPS